MVEPALTSRGKFFCTDEHRRLLYVAMTRAADRLIVCGAQGLNAKPQGCWYDLVHAALWQEAREEPVEEGRHLHEFENP